MHSFRDSTQRRMVVSYRRFGTTYRHIFQRPSSPWRKISRVKHSSVLDCWTLEDGTNRLSQKVGKKLPLYAA